MSPTSAVFKREFFGYFRSAMAYVFLTVFLLASVGIAFFLRQFFERGQATLLSYFDSFPFLYLFLAPAVGMRLWSEESRSGTIELLFTLPITTFGAVLGKFLAAWAFLAIAVLLSFPMALTIGYLGHPDWGVVATSYLGAILMSAGYLGICALVSALTKSQLISFVVSLLVCFVILALGWSVFNPLLHSFLPVWLVDGLANFSFIPHFSPFLQGILDFKDAVYFLALAGFTLFLTVVILERGASMRFRHKFAAGALLVAGLVALNVLAGNLPLRADLTADRIYTLSPGTKALLANIREPVTLDFYFSRGNTGVPIDLKDYADRVEATLWQYVRAAHGRLVLRLIDPEPNTPAEEQAIQSGVRAQRIQPGAEPYYLGLVAIEADQTKAIPGFAPDREPFLEYDLSDLIYSVQQLDKKRLGLITSLPLMGSLRNPMAGEPGAEPQYVVAMWEDTFDVVPVKAGATELPPKLDVLAIVHPENLSRRLQFAIDQFLLGGKPVFVAVDPASEYFKHQRDEMDLFGAPLANVSSDLSTLFAGWGIQYNPQRVVGDNNAATQVLLHDGSLARYSVWLSLDRDDFDRRSPTTAQLRSLLFVEPGSVALAPGSELHFTPLVQTTSQGGEVGASLLQFQRPDDVARELKPTGKKTIAALIAGTFRTAFPQGVPEGATVGGRPAAYLKKSRNGSRLVVVADTDWLLDSFSVRKVNLAGTSGAEPLNDNLAFAANLVDYLSGSDALLSIRGKGASIRPFTVVEKMEAEANLKYQKRLGALESRLKSVQTRIFELRGKQAETNRLVAPPEVKKAIQDFQRQESSLRMRQREIRLSLDEDIRALKRRLLAIDLLGVPLLLCAFGGWYHRWRRR